MSDGRVNTLCVLLLLVSLSLLVWETDSKSFRLGQVDQQLQQRTLERDQAWQFINSLDATGCPSASAHPETTA